MTGILFPTTHFTFYDRVAEMSPLPSPSLHLKVGNIQMIFNRVVVDHSGSLSNHFILFFFWGGLNVFGVRPFLLYHRGGCHFPTSLSSRDRRSEWCTSAAKCLGNADSTRALDPCSLWVSQDQHLRAGNEKWKDPHEKHHPSSGFLYSGIPRFIPSFPAEQQEKEGLFPTKRPRNVWPPA